MVTAKNSQKYLIIPIYMIVLDQYLLIIALINQIWYKFLMFNLVYYHPIIWPKNLKLIMSFTQVIFNFKWDNKLKTNSIKIIFKNTIIQMKKIINYLSQMNPKQILLGKFWI